MVRYNNSQELETWAERQSYQLAQCHFNVKTSTVDNVWELSELKHEEKHNSADLMLEVSKLINIAGATAMPFTIRVQEKYTEAEVRKIMKESNQSLKNHLMQAIFKTTIDSNQ